MRKLIPVFVAVAAMLTFGLTSATAITDGSPDASNAFPHVGLMVASIGGVPQWRCSGTLISPTVYVTAGHCTDGADHIEIWFGTGYPTQIGPADGYPFAGDVGGTPHTVPGYTFPTRDLGLVVLDTPWVASTYGALPTAGQLNSLKPRMSTGFTSVGYGLQKAFPDATAWKESRLKTRYIATPHLLQINTGFVGNFSLLLSNNASTGGTCFGDSGGPNFLGSTNTIAGVTSYGINSNCAGTGGVFRLDKQDLIDWINSY